MHEATSLPQPPRSVKAGAYPWLVVGLLWFCGFFNYADRQAVNSVFPLLKASSTSTTSNWDCSARRSCSSMR